MTRRIPESEDEAYERQRQAEVDALTAEVHPLTCMHCGSSAHVQWFAGREFPWRVLCIAKCCAVRTPDCKTRELALIIWNRRAPRPPVKATKRNEYQGVHIGRKRGRKIP